MSGIFPLSEEGALWFTVALFAIVLIMFAIRGPWHLLQGAVFIAVVCANIYWHLTENKYVNILAGVTAAFIVTALLSLALDFARRVRAALGRGTKTAKLPLPSETDAD